MAERKKIPAILFLRFTFYIKAGKEKGFSFARLESIPLNVAPHMSSLIK